MNIVSYIKTYIKENPNSRMTCLMTMIFNFIGRNRIIGTSGNVIRTSGVFMKRCRVEISGHNNIIDLGGAASYLNNCTIHIDGNNNMIELGKRNVFLNAELWLEDSENHVHFGDRNRILGKTHIAVIEGTSVIFGDECLFSTDVIFRTGDSHSIYEAGTNKRINPSRSIEVGNRVWFGNKTIILKGVSIADDCIVATGAVVTKPVQSNTVVGGNPAKVLKQNVQWGIERTTV